MKQKAEPFISVFKPYRGINKLIHEHGLVLATIVSVAAVAVVVIFIGLSASSSSSSVCSTVLINQAATAIDNNQLSDLQTAASRAQGLSGYKNDPNCMYIVTFYYYKDGNAPEAKTSYTQLTKDTSGSKKIRPALVKYYSIKSLGLDIHYSYVQYEADVHNSLLLSPVQPKTSESKK